jgi:SAM-dependent MidA family methyltransferase
MKPSIEHSVQPAMIEALRQCAGARPAISFADFMEIALYAPGIGYYRKENPRIGYAPGSDFLTATTSAPVFGKLVVAACTHILGGNDPAGFDFVELGAEQGTGVLDGVSHPFRSTRLIGLGETLAIEGSAVVFSNELFDAQPFRRFRSRSGEWRELGVALVGDTLAEVEMEAASCLPDCLPGDAPEGYVIDAPLAATRLARTIAAQPWSGLFVAFDYGKSWEAIAHDAPAGTARAYRRHSQVADLLAHPGDQDLTCHVCWDWLKDALSDVGFADPRVESQESFFTRHAGGFIEAFTSAEAGRVSRDKLSLLQLLHPAHMGQKFQALWALRPATVRRA